MAAAALALAAAPTFGAVPGGVPAALFEARASAQGAARIRLAAALARTWAYAGQPERAAGFAAEAAIAAAIDRIAAIDPSLVRLLADTVTTGATCRYDPDPDRPVRWML